MILVRDLFRLHFGRAKEAVELAREARRIEEAEGNPVSRLLTDAVGDYYTLVLESEYPSLAAYEERTSRGMASDEWKQWYARFVPLVREGRREVFRVVE